MRDPITTMSTINNVNWIDTTRYSKLPNDLTTALRDNGIPYACTSALVLMAGLVDLFKLVNIDFEANMANVPQHVPVFFVHMNKPDMASEDSKFWLNIFRIFFGPVNPYKNFKVVFYGAAIPPNWVIEFAEHFEC